MKFTLSWLKDYTSVEYAPSEIAEKLTMAGLEVDSFENRFAYLDKVVVSRVEHVSKHPGANNLTCCKVNVGKNIGNNKDIIAKDITEKDITEKEDIILNIVCGAPNVREGLVVPCALIGALLPGDIEIKKSKLRGEISEGMLCSASELRLDFSHDGIMELDSNLIPGTPLAKALNLFDYLFEVDLTPNRPDCLSVIGIAREIAAFSDSVGTLNLPFKEINCGSASIHDFATVEVCDSELCPRYTAGMLIDVKVGPSPFWLQDRLLSIGLTPINNIVDVTNFVMMETGQPLHAFDYANIAKSRIEVKRAGDVIPTNGVKLTDSAKLIDGAKPTDHTQSIDGAKPTDHTQSIDSAKSIDHTQSASGTIEFKTLDSKTHILDPDMLMICDGERPVGIAGVMGGENSEILDTTTKVLVESAFFNPISIRKTAKRSGINSDASHRFERGVDPTATKDVLKRALWLMAEVSGGTILNDIIDVYPIKQTPLEIKLECDSLNRRLGTNLTCDEIKKHLESVGFKVSSMMMVTVPSFRVDVTRPEDLSEEVARLWGYNNIQTSFPSVPAKGKAPSPRIIMREQIRDIMNGFGFSEAINYSFTSATACNNLCLEPFDQRRSVEEIINPISEELSVLRTSLLPGLLENMRRNNSQQIDSLRLFEVGKIFIATRKGEQPLEKEMLAGIWTGLRNTISWTDKPVLCDFFDIKGVVQGLFSAFGLDEILFQKIDVDNIEKNTYCQENTYCQKNTYYQKGQGAIITSTSNIYDNSTSNIGVNEPNCNSTVDDSVKLIGSLGKISDQVLKNFGLKQDAFVFEIDIEALLTLAVPPSAMRKTKALPKFPSLSRDMTLILDSSIEAGEVLADVVALKQSVPILEDIFIFDLYEGKPVAEGKKSLSMRIVYRSWEKTLTEKMISSIHADITKRIMEKYKADLP